MNNQIYIRLGKPKMFKESSRPAEPTPIKTFIIKWTIISLLVYFFIGDVFSFLIGLIGL